MATYQRTVVQVKLADSSDFTDSPKDFLPDNYEPATATFRHEIREVTAVTGGTTIELGMYTTVTNIIVKNRDATNYVEATFRTTGGGANSQVLRAAAGQIIATGTAITLTNDLILTANTASVACDVCIIGT